MKNVLLFLIIESFAGLYPLSNSPEPITSTGTGVAVVELFTSQGCSSCPAADQLLNKVVLAAEQEDTPVIGLSYHVTYWNHLGWKDPYSNEKFTQRQKDYAAKFQLDGVYTPQVVVNGHDEFVGSDARQLSSKIKAALAEDSGYSIKATMSKDGVNLNVGWTINNPIEGKQLVIALVESEVSNHIPRGENKGLTLIHHNVVRSLTAIPHPALAATSVIALPDGKVLPGGTSVVMFIQDPETMRISGAVKMVLKQ